MALINTQIKPFQASAFKKGDFIEVSEKDLEGKWSVFFFYPADFTFVCPTELGDLADHYEEFQKRDVEIYAVSTDTHFTHKAWHDSSDTIGKIQYTMIGDPTGAITRNFEVMREEQGLEEVHLARLRCYQQGSGQFSHNTQLEVHTVCVYEHCMHHERTPNPHLDCILGDIQANC